ncbi:MAG: MBOAT family protein, partial [Muribaculaceae bacterium]|nr:MBOAT family protein [Muribaculaceae bacterium]
MLFNSVEFILFLPLVFLLYWFVFKPRKMQNLLLLAASYVFYGWWDWRFLLLIVATSLSSYMSGLLIAQFEGNRTSQRLVSTVNIVFNLLILATFKYFNFFVENLDALFSAMGYKLDWVTLDVILPVGISFYTFQALSYSIDVYRHAIKPTRSMVDFFAYISFF